MVREQIGTITALASAVLAVLGGGWRAVLGLAESAQRTQEVCASLAKAEPHPPVELEPSRGRRG